ncbi:MAG: hypothetical protein R2874_04365 [Desulfobacterales bacterium]
MPPPLQLTALNSGLIPFEVGAVMVISANIGTTITVLMGPSVAFRPKSGSV